MAKVCGHLTTELICGSSLNCFNKAGSTQLSWFAKIGVKGFTEEEEF